MKCRIVSYLFFFITLVSLTLSCQSRPNEVLNRKEMERLMYDIYVAEATMEKDYRSFNTPEKQEAFINEVFKAHEVTQAVWDTSLSWYSDRIDIYLKMNDSVKARLQRARKEIDRLVEEQNRQLFVDPSLLSPSYIPSHHSFSIPGRNSGFTFRLDSADISSRIGDDQFAFTFSVIGIPPVFTSHLSSRLTLVYADTTLTHALEVRENRTYQIDASRYIPGDTLMHINGYLHMQHSLGDGSHVQLYQIALGNEPLDSLDLTSQRKHRDSLAALSPVGKRKMTGRERLKEDTTQALL